MMLFQQWKKCRQLPSAPALTEIEEGVVRSAFYAGAKATLDDIRERWPNGEVEHPVAG